MGQKMASVCGAGIFRPQMRVSSFVQQKEPHQSQDHRLPEQQKALLQKTGHAEENDPPEVSWLMAHTVEFTVCVRKQA